MLEDSIAHNEKRSRRIEALLVLPFTVLIFVFFGYVQENDFPIESKNYTRLILFPSTYALVPSLIVIGTYFLSCYLKSRVATWTIYTFTVIVVSLYFYPNIGKIFWVLTRIVS